MLNIIPPSDVPASDYDVRLKTECYAYNSQVPSEDKIFRVSIKDETNVLGLAALIGGLLILVIGLVFFGIRLTRR